MVCRYALVERQTQSFSPAASLVLGPGVPVTSIQKPAGGFSFAPKRKLAEIEKRTAILSELPSGYGGESGICDVAQRLVL